MRIPSFSEYWSCFATIYQCFEVEKVTKVMRENQVHKTPMLFTQRFLGLMGCLVIEDAKQ